LGRSQRLDYSKITLVKINRVKKIAFLTSKVFLLTASLYMMVFGVVMAVGSDYLTVAAPSQPGLYFANAFPQLQESAVLVDAPPTLPEFAKPVVNPAEQQRNIDIDKAFNYLRDRKSPMAPYAYVVVDAAKRCGGDYRILIALAEVESGLGRQPYRKYNPYGYLNKVQYPNWGVALDKLSCRISEQYIQRFGTDFYAMGKIYTGQANPSGWTAKITKVFNSF
jgi:hypothetical protein